MTTRRSIALLALFSALVAAAALAAFGSGDANAGAEARAKGAVAVPAKALAYASVNLDRDGAPYQALTELARSVDGGEAAIGRLNGMLDGSGEQAQIMRALGGDISVGLIGISLTSGIQPGVEAIVVATAADSSALPGLLTEMGFAQGPELSGQPVWERDAFAITIDGSTAIAATSRATLIDALAAQSGAAPALADDAAFRATIAKLPSDPVAVAYLAPARLAGLVQVAGSLLPQSALPEDAPDTTAALGQLSAALADVRGLGIAITAEQGGLRIVAAGDADQAALERLGARFPASYDPTIDEQVPADALGFAAFRDLGPLLTSALAAAQTQDPQVRTMIAAAERATGLDLAAILAALDGEHALVAVGGEQPAGALLTQPSDPAAAGATLAKAITAAEQLGTTLPIPERLEAKRGELPQVAVTRQGDSATLAIGTAPRLAAAPASAMADSEAYRAIVDRAGVPDQVTGLAYVNVAQLRAEAKAKGMALPTATANIGGVIAWGTADGASLFIAIG